MNWVYSSQSDVSATYLNKDIDLCFGQKLHQNGFFHGLLDQEGDLGGASVFLPPPPPLPRAEPSHRILATNQGTVVKLIRTALNWSRTKYGCHDLQLVRIDDERERKKMNLEEKGGACVVAFYCERRTLLPLYCPC